MVSITSLLDDWLEILFFLIGEISEYENQQVLPG